MRIKVPRCCGCARHTKVSTVLEWLHPGCDTDLPAGFLYFRAGDFSFTIPSEKRFKIVFYRLGAGIRFWSTISVAVAGSSMVQYRLVSISILSVYDIEHVACKVYEYG